jgi:hypothetical protein
LRQRCTLCSGMVFACVCLAFGRGRLKIGFFHLSSRTPTTTATFSSTHSCFTETLGTPRQQSQRSQHLHRNKVTNNDQPWGPIQPQARYISYTETQVNFGSEMLCALTVLPKEEIKELLHFRGKGVVSSVSEDASKGSTSLNFELGKLRTGNLLHKPERIVIESGLV